MDRMNIERWRAAWGRIAGMGDADSIYDRLVEKYSERHRAYHNGMHVAHCLEEFDGIRDFLNHPDEVEIAIWFHDAIYEVKSHENEEKSARWAVEEMEKADAGENSICMVRDLIIATKDHDKQPDSDGMYFMDIDLSILGAPPDMYQEYEKNVGKEYHWVPESIFIEKRHELLNSFLGRKWIFTTEYFRNKYEQRARANLKNVLEKG